MYDNDESVNTGRSVTSSHCHPVAVHLLVKKADTSLNKNFSLGSLFGLYKYRLFLAKDTLNLQPDWLAEFLEQKSNAELSKWENALK